MDVEMQGRSREFLGDFGRGRFSPLGAFEF